VVAVCTDMGTKIRSQPSTSPADDDTSISQLFRNGAENISGVESIRIAQRDNATAWLAVGRIELALRQIGFAVITPNIEETSVAQCYDVGFNLRATRFCIRLKQSAGRRQRIGNPGEIARLRGIHRHGLSLDAAFPVIQDDAESIHTSEAVVAVIGKGTVGLKRQGAVIRTV